MQPLDPHPIKIPYTNYRGETSERTITPIRPWFGSTEWHPQPQWLLRAYDHDKGAERDFAFKEFGSLPLVPPGDKEMYLAGMTEAAEIADAAINCSCDQCEGRRVAANFIRERITELSHDHDSSFTTGKKPWGWCIPRGGDKKPIILEASKFLESAAKAEAAIHELGYFPLYLHPAPSAGRAAALEEAARWHEEEAARKRTVAVKSKRLDAQIATHEASAAHFRALHPLADKPDEASAQGEGSFQDRVKPWMLACFGEEISNDKLERCDRFIEEALELVQAIGYSPDRAHALVDYVFNRGIGEPHQEVGGVMVTLAALCLASGLDMDKAGEDELARIWTKIEKIRAKQAAKPTGSALPVPTSEGEE